MKVLIVDDEAPARQRLEQLIDEQSGHSVVGTASNGHEALALAAREAPDVVLLDIRMPGMDGIETAHHLNALRAPPAVIFTTAYDSYAIEAFEANAVGYVLKPIRRERLAKALKQAARLAPSGLAELQSATGENKERTHLCARVQDELKLIPVKDVVLFLADQKYVRVCHAGGEHLIDESLKRLENEFADRFVRIHRSALVAVAQIAGLRRDADGSTRVELRSGTGDPDGLIISRRHLAQVKKILKTS